MPRFAFENDRTTITLSPGPPSFQRWTATTFSALLAWCTCTWSPVSPAVVLCQFLRSLNMSVYIWMMPRCSSKCDQSSGSCSWNHRSSSISCPWKIIGTPGEVITSAAPRVDRFLGYQLCASPGEISSGTRALPLASSSCDSVKIIRAYASSPILLSMASLTAYMSRCSSAMPTIAPRTVWTNRESHCELNPAPPAPMSFVIHPLPLRSSAMVNFQGWRAWTSSLIHCIRLQPSGRSAAGSTPVSWPCTWRM